MIKFFRHIRKSLLEQNKMGKYFKYAIGEIILVVIGILIALQINNWNELKKEKAFEKEILEQIRANLIKDKITLKEIKVNFEKAMYSSDKILKSKWTKQENDSIKYWLGKIIQFDRFQSLTNAYEVAKSKGLDLITNKQLRFQIGSYYDDEIKRVGKSIEDIEVTFRQDWIPVLRNEAHEVKFKTYVILKDNSILKGNTEAINILRLNKDNYGGGLKSLIKIIGRIDNLLSLIKQELDS